MNGDLKNIFINKALTEYMQRCKVQMTLVGKKMNIGVTNDGINSISYAIAAHEGGGVGKYSFKEYLRMVDMGAGRGHPLGGLKAMKMTLQSSEKSGFAQVKDKTRKPKKLYSKTVYGNLTWLENKLLYGYTEAAKTAIKDEMQHGT